MSHENVEIIRELSSALANAGDWNAAFKLYHPEAEFRDLQHPPDLPEVVQGREAIRRVLANWTEIYDDFGTEVYEYIDANPWVICDTRWHGRVKGSDIPIDVRFGDAYEVKRRQILRVIVGYPDVATALEAVRLEG